MLGKRIFDDEADFGRCFPTALVRAVRSNPKDPPALYIDPIEEIIPTTPMGAFTKKGLRRSDRLNARRSDRCCHALSRLVQTKEHAPVKEMGAPTKKPPCSRQQQHNSAGNLS